MHSLIYTPSVYSCTFSSHQDVTIERDELQLKLRRLQHEMSELKSSDTGDSELLQLRAAKHELERKLTESEDDIGDLQQEMHDLEMVSMTPCASCPSW